jgi:hypothetical protein
MWFWRYQAMAFLSFHRHEGLLIKPHRFNLSTFRHVRTSLRHQEQKLYKHHLFIPNIWEMKRFITTILNTEWGQFLRPNKKQNLCRLQIKVSLSLLDHPSGLCHLSFVVILFGMSNTSYTLCTQSMCPAGFLYKMQQVLLICHAYVDAILMQEKIRHNIWKLFIE